MADLLDKVLKVVEPKAVEPKVVAPKPAPVDTTAWFTGK